MSPPSRSGFTLIEVVGAVLVFTMGVLMVIALSRALGVQMERSALATQVSARVQERIDSLVAEPYASLSLGSSGDTLSVRGIAFLRSTTVSQYSPLLRQITVTVEPMGGDGPRRSSTSYSSDRW